MSLIITFASLRYLGFKFFLSQPQDDSSFLGHYFRYFRIMFDNKVRVEFEIRFFSM